MRWHVRMLGGLVLQEAEGEQRTNTKFYSQKTALLLARLAFPPVRSYGREELIERLWPDGVLESGRANLRNILAALRRQLEPDEDSRGTVVVATNAHVRLQETAFTSDVGLFESALQRARRAGGEAEYEAALREALGLYRGELLPGVYDDWVIQERERLVAVHADALRSLQSLAQKQKDPAEARALALRLEKGSGIAKTVDSPSSVLPASLPPPRSRFFGRDRELREVGALLQSSRVVTLTGVGGVGKTRLAREIASDMSADSTASAAFVPLEAIRQPSQIAGKILSTLTVATASGADPLSQVVSALTEGNVSLLVLDNFEHLLGAGGDASLFVREMTERLPNLRVLITSQRALEASWETAFRVSPLPLPSENMDANVLQTIPSVQLFVDRAQVVRPDFALTERNAGAVGAVCRQLEGVPLSLEIAGARSLVTTPWQIRAELEHRLGFLKRRGEPDSYAGSPRHHSLRSTLEWTYSLLSPLLARFFMRLAPFRGGFTEEMARAVGESDDTLGSIEELCQLSLLYPQESGETMRFYLLETVRDFAREKLTESGEEDAVRERHFQTFLRFAETAKEALFGPEQETWLHRLEQEHDNLRAALDHAVAKPDSLNSLLLGISLARFWETRGHLEEGSLWMGKLLLAVPPPKNAEEKRMCARANNFLGTLLTNANRFDEAKEAFRTAIELFDQDEAKDSFGPLNNLGLIDLYNGEYASAHRTFARCLDILGEGGDPKYLSSLLNNRGMASLHQGNRESAEEDLTGALRHYRQIGNTRGIAKALSNLGALSIECDAYALAEERFRESLLLHETLRDFEGAAICYLGLAGCAIDAGHMRQSASFFGKAEAIRIQINAPVRPSDRSRYENLRSRLRNRLGEEKLREILGKEYEDWKGRSKARENREMTGRFESR